MYDRELIRLIAVQSLVRTSLAISGKNEGWKLFFDENLSPKLPNKLSDLFPDSLHVKYVELRLKRCDRDHL